MRIRVIAVGTRMPRWVEAGVDEYTRRVRPPWRLEWCEIAAAQRTAGTTSPRALEREGERVLAALRDAAASPVALDERGREFDTAGLARWLERRAESCGELALLIGGPDGHAPGVLERAGERLRLSALTLPHALVRVVLAEQLYRAQSLLLGHPYHRA